MIDIHIKVEDSTRDHLVDWAAEDHRTLSNLCAILLTAAVADHLLEQRPRRKAAGR